MTSPSSSEPEVRYKVESAPWISVLVRLLMPIVLIFAAGIVAWFFLRVLDPDPRFDAQAPERGYRPGPMQEALSPEIVAARQAQIVSFGSRFLGQPGHERTFCLIRSQFEMAGLEIYEHGIRTAVPHTQFREIYLVETEDESGATVAPLDDVEIYPFMPNFLQPVVTPEEGITGRLLLLTKENLRSLDRFDDCIGLIDSREEKVDEDFLFSWVRYAQLGLKALIVSHADGLNAASWDRIAAQKGGIVSSVPVNYVRLAASRQIFKYIDRTISIRVRVDYKNTDSVTLLGVMRAPHPIDEAMVIAAPYDVTSVLPDRAPGVLQALKPALQIQILEGLKAYCESLRRDVIFVSFGSSVMAEDGLNQILRVLQENRSPGHANVLLKAFGINSEFSSANPRGSDLRERLRENDRRWEKVRLINDGFNSSGFLLHAGDTERLLAGLPRDAVEFLNDQFAYVVNSVVLELSEPLLRARLAFEGGANKDVASDAFRTYQEALRIHESAVASAGYRPLDLLVSKPEFCSRYGIGERTRQRFDELQSHHEWVALQIEQERRIIELFDRYRQIGVFQSALVPAFDEAEQKEVLGLDTGRQISGPSIASIAGLLSGSVERLGLGDRLEVNQRTPSRLNLIAENTALAPISSTGMWTSFRYPTFTFTGLGRVKSFRRYSDPVDLPFMRNIESMRFSLSAMGETLLSVAHGNAEFIPFHIRDFPIKSFGGKVLVSSFGRSVLPTYPLQNALVAGGRPVHREEDFSRPGYFQHPLVFTDVYGRYDLPHNVSDFPVWKRSSLNQSYSPLAVGYGEDGLIAFMKDEGEDGQRLFKSVNLSFANRQAIRNVTMVTFRASPVTLLDMTNPHTFKDFTAVQMVRREGLTRFRKQCIFDEGIGLHTTYLEPAARAYVLLQSGEPGNELVKVTRASLTGREISGEGYLVADHPFVFDVSIEAARSLASVNARRLELQNRYAMADARTNEYQKKSIQLLWESKIPGSSKRLSRIKGREAATYGMLNHPVLRKSIGEAVMGIVWYLGILVPFVYFSERLIFCYPDIRKQLAAQGVIFIVIFSLLGTIHPAFAMVRSSLMILLGFVIVLITVGITVLFSGKFRENLEDIRRRRGKVSGAEVNALAVTGSAFVLGLNNMHRRKMRTGMTCGTLTLLIFAMICFTSARNDLVEERFAVGKAPYQGMLIKRERFEPLSLAEVFALKEQYGDQFDICPRRMLVGQFDVAANKRYNPELSIVSTASGRSRRVPFDSALHWSHREPLRKSLELVTERRWFRPADDRESNVPCPVFIPDRMAEELGITPQVVNQRGVIVKINGAPFRVEGIFTSESLDALRDLDGMDVRPFDIEAMPEVIQPQHSASLAKVHAAADDPRIPAERIVILPLRRALPVIPRGTEITASLAVSMPGTGFAAVEEVISRHLERTGERVFFGLDNVSFRGRRAREFSLAGSIDLMIPLLIGVFTVLQTMQGSVYERREEIYVYNSVGIAPRYIFFMFLAEALVYAVIGSMLGFLLSQTFGRVLTELGLTGGLNMTYTTRVTVFASLAIFTTTLLSTYFPARSAMKIAAPTEDSGWSMPEALEDRLSFELPFLFGVQERVAVLAFFRRYLVDHGEGGAGRFVSSIPRMTLFEDQSATSPEKLQPRLQSHVWLRPFDLAVSEEMTISVLPDRETNQFKAVVSLGRLSGSRESWIRLNHGFIRLIRRQFLHWRIVDTHERERLFEEGKSALAQLS